MVVLRYPPVREGLSDENVGEAGPKPAPCSLSNSRWILNLGDSANSIELRQKHSTQSGSENSEIQLAYA